MSKEWDQIQVTVAMKTNNVSQKIKNYIAVINSTYTVHAKGVSIITNCKSSKQPYQHNAQLKNSIFWKAVDSMYSITQTKYIAINHSSHKDLKFSV